MIRPYLNFKKGDCEPAFTLYERAFDGNIQFLERYGDKATDPADKDLVMHAEMNLTEVGGIAGGDATWPYEAGMPVNILVRLESAEKAKKSWAVLACEGTVIMPLQKTDYAILQGTIKDKYGFCWIFNVVENYPWGE